MQGWSCQIEFWQNNFFPTQVYFQTTGFSFELLSKVFQGDLTFTKVSEELIAQHSRLHEREHKGKGHSYGKSLFTKGGKSFGKKSGSWKSYHAEEDVSNS